MYKCSWEKEIEKERIERMKSVNYFLNASNEIEDIEKSVVNDLKYNNQTGLNEIIKKGSEIKERLEGENSSLAVKLATCNMAIAKLGGEITIKPMRKPYESEEGYGALFTYDYSQIYPKEKSDSEEVSLDEFVIPDEQVKLMKEYNSHCDNRVRLVKEIKLMKTIIDNIKLKKDYKLNLEVASKLGF